MQLLSCSEESCITIHTLKNNIIKKQAAIRFRSKKMNGLKIPTFSPFT